MRLTDSEVQTILNALSLYSADNVLFAERVGQSGKPGAEYAARALLRGSEVAMAVYAKIEDAGSVVLDGVTYEED